MPDSSDISFSILPTFSAKFLNSVPESESKDDFSSALLILVSTNCGDLKSSEAMARLAVSDGVRFGAGIG